MQSKALEETALQSEKTANIATVAVCEASIASALVSQNTAVAATQDRRDAYDAVAEVLATKKAKLNSYDVTLGEMATKVEALTNSRNAAEIDVKKATHKITQTSALKRDAARYLVELSPRVYCSSSVFLMNSHDFSCIIPAFQILMLLC